MAAAEVGQTYMVTFNGFLHAQRIMTTFYYRLNIMPAAVTTVQASDNLRFQLVAANGLRVDYLACCPNNYTLGETWIQCILPVRIRKKVYPDSQSGTDPVALVTTNVSMSIARQGEVAAHNTQGGIRPPISPLSITNGLLSTALFNKAVTLADEIKTVYADQVNGYGWIPGIVSKVPGQQPGQLIPQFTQVFYTDVGEAARVARRRTVGLGI